MWSVIKPKRRHMLALAIFVPFLLLVLYAVTVNSEDYEEAQRFVLQDSHVAASIGKVQSVGFRFWDGFESVGGNQGFASYSFNTVTEKGKFIIDVRLRCVHDVWQVQAAKIRRHDGTQSNIPMT